MTSMHTTTKLQVNLNVRLEIEEHKKGESSYLVYIATWLNYKSIGKSFDEALIDLKKQIEDVKESIWFAV